MNKELLRKTIWRIKWKNLAILGIWLLLILDATVTVAGLFKFAEIFNIIK